MDVVAPATAFGVPTTDDEDAGQEAAAQSQLLPARDVKPVWGAQKMVPDELLRARLGETERGKQLVSVLDSHGSASVETSKIVTVWERKLQSNEAKFEQENQTKLALPEDSPDLAAMLQKMSDTKKASDHLRSKIKTPPMHKSSLAVNGVTADGSDLVILFGVVELLCRYPDTLSGTGFETGIATDGIRCTRWFSVPTKALDQLGIIVDAIKHRVTSASGELLAKKRACLAWTVHDTNLTKDKRTGKTKLGFSAFNSVKKQGNKSTWTYSENTLSYGHGNSSLGALCASALESAITEEEFQHAVRWALLGSQWDAGWMPLISSPSKLFSFDAIEIEKKARLTFTFECLMELCQGFHKENEGIISHMEAKRREEEERRRKEENKAFPKKDVKKWLLQETQEGTEAGTPPGSMVEYLYFVDTFLLFVDAGIPS